VNDSAQGNPLEGLTTHAPEWWEAVYRAWAKHAYLGAMAAYRNKKRAADASDVEDVVQEVFAELMKTKGIDDQTTSIPGVLYTRAHRRAIDRLRRSSWISDVDPPDRPDSQDAYEAVDEEDERIRLGGVVWDNLPSLDPRERQVWRRVFQDGASHNQVAAELGISRVRVTQIVRAMLPKLIRGSGYEIRVRRPGGGTQDG
jgi:RNA polymerase sigma factor (sigma-70 family)